MSTIEQLVIDIEAACRALELRETLSIGLRGAEQNRWFFVTFGDQPLDSLHANPYYKTAATLEGALGALRAALHAQIRLRLSLYAPTVDKLQAGPCPGDR